MYKPLHLGCNSEQEQNISFYKVGLLVPLHLICNYNQLMCYLMNKCFVNEKNAAVILQFMKTTDQVR